MPQATWSITGGGYIWTSDIMSLTFTTGRQKYLDNYAGGRCVVTVKNNTGWVSNLVYGTKCEVWTGVLGYQIYRSMWISEINYSDHPGSTGISTATITLVDWIARAGRIYANAKSLTQDETVDQLGQFLATNGGPLPADMLLSSTVTYGNGSSIASATTYSGTVANYLNLLVTTERSYVRLSAEYLTLVSRNKINVSGVSLLTFGRTTSNSQIAYQSFERIQNGTQFINVATVQPSGLTAQTSTNSSSVSSYGASYYSSATVDYNETQAAGNASWISTMMSVPANLRFALTFSDRAQNSFALTGFLEGQQSVGQIYTLNYTPPNGAATSVTCIIEGFDVNVTPDQSLFTIYFSPLAYYQFFTLNSSTLGILDTSRLGW